MGYLGFLTLSARNLFWESRNSKLYLLILRHEVFLTFSGHNKQAYATFYTYHTYKGSFAKCVRPLQTFLALNPFFTVVVFKEWTCTARTSTIRLLLLILRKHLTRLMVKLVVSLHFFLSPTWVLPGLSFSPEMGLLLLFSVCCLLRFRKGTWDRLVSYVCR